MKNKVFVILFLVPVMFHSCKKSEGWDNQLNGTWTEVVAYNAKALPSNCDIVFSESMMSICGASLTENLGKNSHIHAIGGQIWIDYKLAFRNHIEYRYDYQFDGQYLYIIEETSSKNVGMVPASSNYKKYERK